MPALGHPARPSGASQRPVPTLAAISHHPSEPGGIRRLHPGGVSRSGCLLTYYRSWAHQQLSDLWYSLEQLVAANLAALHPPLGLRAAREDFAGGRGGPLSQRPTVHRQPGAGQEARAAPKPLLPPLAVWPMRGSGRFRLFQESSSEPVQSHCA